MDFDYNSDSRNGKVISIFKFPRNKNLRQGGSWKLTVKILSQYNIPEYVIFISKKIIVNSICMWENILGNFETYVNGLCVQVFLRVMASAF